MQAIRGTGRKGKRQRNWEPRSETRRKQLNQPREQNKFKSPVSQGKNRGKNGGERVSQKYQSRQAEKEER